MFGRPSDSFTALPGSPNGAEFGKYCQKFAIFETPAVTVNINKMYQIIYQNFRKYSSDKCV